MRETLVMVLVSPQFLYLSGQSRPDAGGQLSETQFATRLSYFLWNSMPDEHLLEKAVGGQLKNREELSQVVSRMLADPKSARFVNSFTDQWLNLSGLDRVAVNPEYYPDFDDRLKEDMREESRRFVGEILLNDLSALNLIDSDFAMLNFRLAKHYGLKGPRGSEFQRVPVSVEDRRGGLLTQAGVLLANSTGEDSHPIRRAVWLLDRLLDSPPSPPPPDVPVLDAGKAARSGLSIVEQLQQHREKKSCNNCHRKIDPWGIAFENYDAVGRWRSEVVRTEKKGRKQPLTIDSRSELPGGEVIDGMPGLKKHLMAREKDRFARALVSRLLVYALGRSLDSADESIVVSLTKDFVDNGYKLSKLVHAIVASDLFRQE